MEPQTIDVDVIATAYSKANKRAAMLKAELGEIDSDMETMKRILLEHMQNNKLQSLKTSRGDKLCLRKDTRFSTGDWVSFKQWVLQHPEAIDLFEHRLHQGNTKQWLKDTEGNTDMVPPGLNSFTKTAITITLVKE